MKVRRNDEVTRRMKSRSILYLAIIITFLCQRSAFGNDRFIEKIDRVKQATVAIACVDQQGQISSIEGTGFFVSYDGSFLTASHVARGLYLLPPERINQCIIPAIYFPKEGWKEGREVAIRWFRIKDCVFDDEIDLAKCTIFNNPFEDVAIKVKPQIVQFDSMTRRVGTEIAFTGFPLNIIQPVTARSHIAGYLGRGSQSGIFEIIIDNNNWPGMSGAPVYLNNGRIIGVILRRGTNDAEGLAFARSSNIIVEFLSKHSFSTNKTKGAN